jgi:TonB family protein
LKLKILLKQQHGATPEITKSSTLEYQRELLKALSSLVLLPSKSLIPQPHCAAGDSGVCPRRRQPLLKRANTLEVRQTPQLRVVSQNPGRESFQMPNRIPTFSYELPPSRSKERMAWSLILHALAVLLLVKFASWLPAPRVARDNTASVTPIYLPKLQPAPVPIVPKIEAPPVRVLAKLAPPKIEAPPPPVEKAKAPEPVVPPPEPKKEVATETFPAAPAVTPEPRKKEKEVITNTFASGSSAPVTEHKPLREVQTGGFGDPNGVAGSSEAKRTLTVASVGSFDLPSGGGKGNGSGGTHGTPGTVASAGFGDGVAGPGAGDHPRGTISTTGFSDMKATATPKGHAENKPETAPVEILYKPKPTYTAEARQLRIQGEVLVEVMFTAAGNLRVNRVTKGLGHGLDEAALRAAQLIKFKPAERDGRPYDSNGVVHIIFELAE